jgi:predicted lipoprotein with Yx(FWY)xxD motif
VVAVAVALVTGLAACGGSGHARAEVGTRPLPGLGTVLVNGKGLTLYMFVPDRHARVTCSGRCAVAWPPDAVADGGTVVAGGRAKASLLGTVPDPDASGKRVVTYAGWPLYTFTADSGPGQDNGQDLDNNGGLWFVMRPSGQIVRTPR